MAMGTDERIAREIENEFERLKSRGQILKGVRLEVRFKPSNDPDCRWQGVAYNAKTKHRITQIAPKPFQLRRQFLQSIP